jgi:hypothetical protein
MIVRKKASKAAKKHNHIFEQLSMHKGEQSNDSRKKKEMKLEKKLRKLRTILKWKKKKRRWKERNNARKKKVKYKHARIIQMISNMQYEVILLYLPSKNR